MPLGTIDYFQQSFSEIEIKQRVKTDNSVKNPAKKLFSGNRHAQAANNLSLRMAKKHLIFLFALNGRQKFFKMPILQPYHSNHLDTNGQNVMSVFHSV
ncbi:MAG: hypothetical protein E7I11_00200, partial [Klebsiella michiganensis]|nr:hypothetical protein [Klebsiella michiganensis]MDU4310209.1 hypothetical protein [Klebsiella michiganensis]